MKITPKPGDYVRTEGMTLDQYHAVARIFLSYGFNVGEYPSLVHLRGQKYFGISAVGKCLFHAALAGNDEYYFTGRELSLSDLLGDEEVVWSGDGWPLVGTECEFSYNKVNWFATKILFMGSKMAVFTTDHADETERSAFLREIIFRPLKSERELAIEEMVKVVSHYPHDSQAVTQICGQLYDKGYRKTKDAEK